MLNKFWPEEYPYEAIPIPTKVITYDQVQDAVEPVISKLLEVPVEETNEEKESGEKTKKDVKDMTKDERVEYNRKKLLGEPDQIMDDKYYTIKVYNQLSKDVFDDFMMVRIYVGMDICFTQYPVYRGNGLFEVKGTRVGSVDCDGEPHYPFCFIDNIVATEVCNDLNQILSKEWPDVYEYIPLPIPDAKFNHSDVNNSILMNVATERNEFINIDMSTMTESDQALIKLICKKYIPDQDDKDMDKGKDEIEDVKKASIVSKMVKKIES